MAVPVEKEDREATKQLHYALPTTSSIGISYKSYMKQIAERVKNTEIASPIYTESQSLPVGINAARSQSLVHEESPEDIRGRYRSLKYPGLVSDKARRKTFHSWKHGDVQRVDSLVEAGFWYRGEEDKVTCFCCGKTTYNWERTDDPWHQHALWSPQCEHVVFSKGQPYISKVLADQIRDNNTEVRQNNQQGEGFSGGFSHASPQILEPTSGQITTQETPNLQTTQAVTFSSPSITSLPTTAQLSIIPHQPRPRPYHPDYCDVDVRRATFRNWEFSQIQPVENLVKAGFFYKGVGDQVTCYQCGYTLHNWEVTDEPWEEHKKWNPQCPLVLDHQGEPPTEGVTIRTASPQDHVDEPQIQGNFQSNSEEEAPGTRKQKKKQKKRKAKRNLKDSEQKPEASQNNKSLTNEATALEEENLKLKDSKLCKICLSEELNIVFLPCGHLVSCETCASKVTHCPVCRKYIRGTVRTFWG